MTERIEATDFEVARKHAKPKCRLCYGSGMVASFLHGENGRYRHERACWCAVTNWADAVMAPKPEDDRGHGLDRTGEGATSIPENTGSADG